jgi:hypothetical protein
MQESELPIVVQPGTKIGAEHRLQVVQAGSRHLPMLQFVVLETMRMGIEHLKWPAVAPVLVVLAAIRKEV